MELIPNRISRWELLGGEAAPHMRNGHLLTVPEFLQEECDEGLLSAPQNQQTMTSEVPGRLWWGPPHCTIEPAVRQWSTRPPFTLLQTKAHVRIWKTDLDPYICLPVSLLNVGALVKLPFQRFVITCFFYKQIGFVIKSRLLGIPEGSVLP